MKRLRQSVWIQRFWKFAGAVSVRVKVLGIVIGVILLLGAFVIVQMRSVLISTLNQELEEQGIALANNIAQDAAVVLAGQGRAGLPLLLTDRKIHYSTESHNTQVDYILVEDETHTRVYGAGDSPPDMDTGATDHTHGHHPVFVSSDGSVVEIRQPIGATGWLLRLGLSRRVVMQTVNQVSIQLASITLFMLGIGFAAAFFLTWILTRPILDLVKATHAVSRGDFSQRVSLWANDEIGALAHAFNQMTASLAQAERERKDRERLQQQYISGVILAQENERQRIARELHDSTSQSLTSLLVGLQNLKQSTNSAEMERQVNELRDVIGGTLDEIRGIVWQLRPSVLDDLGLTIAIENYVENFRQRHGIPVDLVVSGLEGRLQSEIETTIYRIIQEGLTNIARHARARSVSVIVTCKGQCLKVIIEDDGIGFDPVAVNNKQQSLGVRGIHERVKLFGGRVTIESQPGQGTTLFIEMPCEFEATGVEFHSTPRA